MHDNLVIFASSRSNGNTRRAINQVFKNIKHLTIDLSKKSISYYDYANRNRNDDFLAIAQLATQYKRMFICSPVYWYSISAPMKVFFDRFTDLITIAKPLGLGLEGKECYVIASGTDKELPNCFTEPIKRTCQYMNMKYISDLYYYAGEDTKLLAKNIDNITEFQSLITS